MEIQRKHILWTGLFALVLASIIGLLALLPSSSETKQRSERFNNALTDQTVGAYYQDVLTSPEKPDSVPNAPSFDVATYTLDTELTQSIQNPSIYTFASDIKSYADVISPSLFRLNNTPASIIVEDTIVYEYEDQSLAVDVNTGAYQYTGTSHAVPFAVSEGTLLTEIANYFTNIGVIDQFTEAKALYTRESTGDLLYVVLNRTRDKAGLPIVNPATTVTLPDDASIASIDANVYWPEDPSDSDITFASDMPGKARKDDFNTMTIALTKSGTIISIESNMRPFASVLELQNTQMSLISEEEVMTELANNGTVFDVTLPAGEGSLEFEKVYPKNTFTSDEVVITDIGLVYAEKPLQTDQRYLMPMYLVRGYAETDTGYRTRVSQYVPAIDAPERLAYSFAPKVHAVNHSPLAQSTFFENILQLFGIGGSSNTATPTDTSQTGSRSIQYGTFPINGDGARITPPSDIVTPPDDQVKTPTPIKTPPPTPTPFIPTSTPRPPTPTSPPPTPTDRPPTPTDTPPKITSSPPTPTRFIPTNTPQPPTPQLTPDETDECYYIIDGVRVDGKPVFIEGIGTVYVFESLVVDGVAEPLSMLTRDAHSATIWTAVRQGAFNGFLNELQARIANAYVNDSSLISYLEGGSLDFDTFFESEINHYAIPVATDDETIRRRHYASLRYNVLLQVSNQLVPAIQDGTLNSFAALSNSEYSGLSNDDLLDGLLSLNTRTSGVREYLLPVPDPCDPVSSGSPTVYFGGDNEVELEFLHNKTTYADPYVSQKYVISPNELPHNKLYYEYDRTKVSFERPQIGMVVNRENLITEIERIGFKIGMNSQMVDDLLQDMKASLISQPIEGNVFVGLIEEVNINAQLPISASEHIQRVFFYFEPTQSSYKTENTDFPQLIHGSAATEIGVYIQE